VFIHRNAIDSVFWLNILLCILIWIPGEPSLLLCEVKYAVGGSAALNK